jgi:pantoate--beta-alanine ligase
LSGVRVIRDLAEMQGASDSMRSQGTRIGLVPTMGYLHEGHQSLIRRARRTVDRVVVSVFVNPTQFGPEEDFGAYPRDFERDLEIVEACGGEIVFAPSLEVMYPDGFSTHVSVEGLSDILEGASRPGHFRGVATVVTKLLTCVRPHAAVFGRKDAQQVAVITRLVEDLNLGTDILVSPTVREGDGLARSSRNMFLTAEERTQSTVLFQALREARHRLERGVRAVDLLESGMRRTIESRSLAKVDYAAIRDLDSFREIEEVSGPALAAVAVRFGKARLIDNLILYPGEAIEEPEK